MKKKIKVAQKKVLKHDGKFVDFARLNEGIFYSDKPEVFDTDFDLEEVKKYYTFNVNFGFLPELGDMEANIDKCSLEYAFIGFE